MSLKPQNPPGVAPVKNKKVHFWTTFFQFSLKNSQKGPLHLTMSISRAEKFSNIFFFGDHLGLPLMGTPFRTNTDMIFGTIVQLDIYNNYVKYQTCGVSENDLRQYNRSGPMTLYLQGP